MGKQLTLDEMKESCVHSCDQLINMIETEKVMNNLDAQLKIEEDKAEDYEVDIQSSGSSPTNSKML